ESLRVGVARCARPCVASPTSAAVRVSGASGELRCAFHPGIQRIGLHLPPLHAQFLLGKLLVEEGKAYKNGNGRFNV
uniref:Uncharacterized protein n=1 Tax=Leersia perrieri TaxID=77586 RepID=A0A0D9VVL0_9ORYZ